MKINSAVWAVLLAGLLLPLSFSCKKDTIKTVPSVNMAVVSNITGITADCGGVLTNGGGATVTARGVCWNVKADPTVADSKTSDGKGLGSFVSNLTALTPGVTYTIRAYATNEVGTSYSSPATFTTIALVPVLTTIEITAITPTTAQSGATITTDGGLPVTARGVCWNTVENPTIANSKTSDGTGTGSFTSTAIGLAPGKVYYLRAYATNSVGTAYGNQVTITTTATTPVLTSAQASATLPTSLTSGGIITSDGGPAITERGVCWSTVQNPTITDSKTSDGAGIGSFTSSITGLTSGTTYYIRAYATNSIGTAYGNQITTKTVTLYLPTINTPPMASITATTMTSGGNISSDGGAPVTARGVCYNTTQNPTIADSKTSDNAGTGSFTSSIIGLTPGATYYIRAYATNSVGTAYGNQVLAATTPVLPVLTTNKFSAIWITTATCGGNITSDGGGAITDRGVCWSTSQNPTTSNSKTFDGTGSGSFTSNMTLLGAKTTYYVRAYATNSIGTVYGQQEILTTLPYLPIVTTTDVKSVLGGTTAKSGGSITNDGGATITARGVCWSTTQTPSTGNSRTNDGTGSGIFTSSITGLVVGETYYFRAYAVTNAGTAYGNQIVLTFPSNLPTLNTFDVSNITATTASCGGRITSDGATMVTSHGICWSTNENPTIADTKTTDSSSSYSFTNNMSGLTANTTYYVRPYATNSYGTSYGSNMTFTTLAQ